MTGYNIARRLSHLEGLHFPGEVVFEGLMYISENQIIVDDKVYTAVEQIPDDLREQYGHAIALGITTQGESLDSEAQEECRQKTEKLLSIFRRYA